ncbi:restriction endonuclease subunit S [Thalassospira marina]|uniref:Type I restriction modification DNA specificity domain-containing protein n=1 Tax=Thalassospira marina TaxID=2048283 RepID=A0A2N3KU20_9PROT|nr:restriction endonuclease subunit S [Thalassospira marina]PKR54048.1 hypothetical protein COO20_10855 [Thalassospira marina]
MRGWQTKPLEEVTYLAGRIGWKGLTAKEYTDTGPLFLSVHSLNYGDWVDFRDANHITQERYDESPEIMLQANDVLICKDGAGIGKTGIIKSLPEPATINSSLLLIRAQKDLLPKFLYYALSSPSFQRIVQERIEGATTPHLYQKDIRQFSISYPSLPEQKRIVAILNEAFEGIDAAIDNTQANLAAACELFESHLNSTFLAMAHNCENIPLEDLCSKITKGSSPKWQGINYVEDPGILFITSENVGSNKIILDKKKYVEEKFNIKEKKSILKKGDVLTNIVGASIGRTALFEIDEDSNINQAVCLIRPKKEKLSGIYLSIILNSPFFRRILHENEVNNARANLSLKFFRELKIPTPSTENQRELVSKIKTLEEDTFTLQTLYQRKLDALQELKQSILAKAFRGEMTQDEIAT